jgi:hypothetical protein
MPRAFKPKDSAKSGSCNILINILNGLLEVIHDERKVGEVEGRRIIQ